jgi:hypothetical protein
MHRSLRSLLHSPLNATIVGRTKEGAIMSLYAVVLTTLLIAQPSGAAEPVSDGATANDARRARDLVFVGTVIEINSHGADDLKRWVVAVTVDRIISGDFTGKGFEFAVHSPAKSGLEVGKSYTIRAKWTGKGYAVDERQWRRR